MIKQIYKYLSSYFIKYKKISIFNNIIKKNYKKNCNYNKYILS